MQRVRIHEADGDVVEGIEFSDGFVIIRWPNPESHVHAFINRAALEGAEQFEGARFEWLDAEADTLEQQLREKLADEIDDIQRDGFGSERDRGLDEAAATVRGES